MSGHLIAPKPTNTKKHIMKLLHRFYCVWRDAFGGVEHPGASISYIFERLQSGTSRSRPQSIIRNVRQINKNSFYALGLRYYVMLIRNEGFKVFYKIHNCISGSF